jgi:hypothetical protein
MIKFGFQAGGLKGSLTVGVTCAGAGLDSLYEQDSAERGKRLKMPQNPQRQVHALLAAFLGMKYS